ncbi:hypothetical protein HDU93_004650 [Gonapodya sp. JEL0774]|nr:hypothetical protein HDU93_004650 [Gonapodya sp. JEL0774]
MGKRSQELPASCASPSRGKNIAEHERTSHAIATLPTILARASVLISHRSTIYAEFASRLSRSGRPQLGESVIRDPIARIRDGFAGTVFAVNDVIEGWVAVPEAGGLERAVQVIAGLADGMQVAQESGLSALFPDSVLRGSCLGGGGGSSDFLVDTGGVDQ